MLSLRALTPVALSATVLATAAVASPNGNAGAAPAARHVDSMASLKAMTAAQMNAAREIILDCYDRGCAIRLAIRFKYSAPNKIAANGVTVVAPRDGSCAVQGCMVAALPSSRLPVGLAGAYCDSVDGTASTEHDDGAALQSAIDAAGATYAVYIPKTGKYCRSSIGLRVAADHQSWVGGGGVIWTTPGVTGITDTKNGWTIDGLTLLGPQYANVMGPKPAMTYRVGETAILASGVMHSGAKPDYIVGVTIKNVTTIGWGDYGIAFGKTNGLNRGFVDTFSIQSPTVKYSGNTGIGILSSRNGSISDVKIQHTGPGAHLGEHYEAYGLIISRHTTDAGEIETLPLSSNIVVSGGIISDNPHWECADTHGGQNIVFKGLTLRGCLTGMAVVDCPNSAGVDTYGPHNVTLSDLTIESDRTDGNAHFGVVFQGADDWSDRGVATGSISNVTVSNYGMQASENGGAVTIYNTRGLTVDKVVVKYPSPNGFSLTGGNRGLKISNSTVLNPWTNSPHAGEAIGVFSDAYPLPVGCHPGPNDPPPQCVSWHGNEVRLDNVTVLQDANFGRIVPPPVYGLLTASGIGLRANTTNDEVLFGRFETNATTPYMISTDTRGWTGSPVASVSNLVTVVANGTVSPITVPNRLVTAPPTCVLLKVAGRPAAFRITATPGAGFTFTSAAAGDRSTYTCNIR